MKCRDCKYRIEFVRPDGRGAASACEVDTSWVKSVKERDEACKYFRVKEVTEK